MMNLLLAAAFTLSPAAQQPAPDPPSPQLIEQAVEAFDQAFRKGHTPERLEALETYGAVNDVRVIRCVAKGLRDKEPAVQLAAVDALRWLEHPEALAELHNAYKKDKKIKNNDALYEAFIWAIGQHGDKKSIEVLLEGSLASAPRDIQVARIHSLGHIRDKASVEELISLLQKTGRRGRRGGGQPLMKEFSISLQVLTGEDLGKDEQAWEKWWRANKKTFEVSAEPRGLSKRVEKALEKRWTKSKKKDEDSRRRGAGGG